jgi:hypothetical protein
LGVQGRPFHPEFEEKILKLLRETDMTIGEIAERVSCSRSLVGTLNRKRNVRFYGGARSRWTVAGGSLCEGRRPAGADQSNSHQKSNVRP